MSEETAGTPRVDEVAEMLPDAEVIAGRLVYMGQATERVSAEFARQLERELAALTTQRDQFEKEYEDCDSWRKHFTERAFAAEAQRDELQKRIGYTAVPVAEGGANIDGLVERLLAISGAESTDEALDIFRRERAANVELAAQSQRFEDGLRWYADGHHYDLPDWEDCSGESSNWLFPPPDVTEAAWMVDDGGVAQSILDHGHSINPNHADDDSITIPPTLATGTASTTRLPTNETELRAELDAAKRALAEQPLDARRYRWLRETDDAPLLRGSLDTLSGDELDKAIDAALAAKSTEQGGL